MRMRLSGKATKHDKRNDRNTALLNRFWSRDIRDSAGNSMYAIAVSGVLVCVASRDPKLYCASWGRPIKRPMIAVLNVSPN